MSQHFRIEAGALTDVGLKRDHNEDRFLSRADLGLFAVADGMGGHAAGEVASGVIVDTLSGLPPQSDPKALLRSVEDALQAANVGVRQIAMARGLGVIGSTVVALVTLDRRWACLWAGDSRAYHLRGGVVTQITRDHTEAARLVAEGVLSPAEAKNYPRRNVITRAIGAADDLTLDLVTGEIERGDVFLLCSDGLTGHVEDAEIGDIVAGRPPAQACRDLVELALRRGGLDNVTVVVVAFRERLTAQSEEPTAVDKSR